MAGEAWWIGRVRSLLAEKATELGPLWALSVRLQFVRDNVDAGLLETDFRADPDARALWAAFDVREAEVHRALDDAGERVARSVRTGALTPAAFRATWEGLGFAPAAEGTGTPADDWLDALLRISRHTLGEERVRFAMPNMSSRAHRIADFLAVTRPGPDDVVVDVGAGSGKVALTVAASCRTEVRGVECGGSFVDQARCSAGHLGLGNVDFEHADVRDVDLSSGSIFYLYHPFHGAPARAVAEALGRLARTKAITVYGAGPTYDFAEHFLREAEHGALRLSERRGEFSEVFVLRSAS